MAQPYGRSPSPAARLSPRALSESSFDTSVLDTSVTSAEHGAGGGGGMLRLQPAESYRREPAEWSESGWDDERSEAGWTEDQTVAGEPDEEEEDDDTTIQYVAVNTRKEMKIADVVSATPALDSFSIMDQVFGPAALASSAAEAEESAVSGRRSPRRISPWSPTEGEQLLDGTPSMVYTPPFRRLLDPRTQPALSLALPAAWSERLRRVYSARVLA